MSAVLALRAAKLRPIPVGLLYYAGVRCPFCGGRHFHIRNVTAECATCAAALIVSNSSEEVLYHG